MVWRIFVAIKKGRWKERLGNERVLQSFKGQAGIWGHLLLIALDHEIDLVIHIEESVFMNKQGLERHVRLEISM